MLTMALREKLNFLFMIVLPSNSLTTRSDVGRNELNGMLKQNWGRKCCGLPQNVHPFICKG